MQKILKIRIDNISLKEATETALQWAQGDTKRMIVTPNPEMILEAQKNSKFLRILNNSNLNIPDGTGLLWAAKYLKITEKTKFKAIKLMKWVTSLLAIAIYPPYIHSEIKERVTGADLMQEICKKSGKLKLKIFLLGAAEGVAEKVKNTLEKKYPEIQIVGTYAGKPLTTEDNKIREKVDKSKADIIFVAYGAPSQEFWIARNLKKFKTIKLAIGIGGTFDYIAGVQKRSPRWMQKLGLEWLYRLLQQPKRLRRIYNATIKFPITVGL